jgi:hypothetical protein
MTAAAAVGSSIEHISKELDQLVGDQLSVVTYKLLARQFNIPYDTAKRILFQYITKRGQVRAVSCVASTLLVRQATAPPTLSTDCADQ